MHYPPTIMMSIVCAGCFEPYSVRCRVCDDCLCQRRLYSYLAVSFKYKPTGKDSAVWGCRIRPSSCLMMIAAAFLVLLRPYSIQCVLLLLLLLLGTIATILFFCCWHRRLRNGKHPIKSVLSGRPKSRGEWRSILMTAVRMRNDPQSVFSHGLVNVV